MTIPARRTARIWLLLVLLIAFKIVLILTDGKPSVFMGDSAVYLWTALHGHIPHDRSFVYGFLLRPLAVWPHSLLALVLAQAAMSGVAAWLIAVNLTVFFGLRFRAAALLSLLCAAEPLQLLSERYVLTDTVALFLFAILVTGSLSFSRHRTHAALALTMLAGVALIGIRMSYLPVVLLDFVLLPLLWMRPDRTRATDRVTWRLAMAALFWLGAGQFLLYGYRRLNASVTGMSPPAYLYSDGLFLLSDVAPVVRPSDIPKTITGKPLLDSVRFTLTDPMYRQAHFFNEGGLCWAVRRAVPGEYRANAVAREIALHAIASHPLSFAGLAIHTWAEYFRVPVLRALMKIDEGGLSASDEPFRAEVQARLGTDLGGPATGLFAWHPIRSWYRLAIPWYWALVTAPLIMPLTLLRTRRRPDIATALVHLYTMTLLGTAILLAPHAEPRYLIPVAWLMFLCVGTLLRCHRCETTAAAV